LCPDGAVDDRAAAVLRLLSDDALRARMSATARAGALARFARAPLVERYETYYLSVLSSSSRS
jgi:hypothetical protein